MKVLLSIATSVLLASNAYAHQGHDDHGSGPRITHGGVVKEGKILNMELVTQGSSIMLYPLSKDGEAIPIKDITIAASSQAPKKAKSKVDLKPGADHFMGTVESKGSYRFELQVEATYKGKKDSLKFQVEPQG